MYTRLYNFVNKHNILYPIQHNFQPGNSTMMSLNNLQDKTTEAMDRNECFVGVFIDIAKTFNTVCYNFLMIKLQNVRIRGLVFNYWFSI